VVRALFGAAAGTACALLLLAWLGASHGYANGIPTNGMPPGVGVAALEAAACVVFYGPVSAACGAVIGGLAGYGSWLVRPRRRGAN
jgi:hypothetical protein